MTDVHDTRRGEAALLARYENVVCAYNIHSQAALRAFQRYYAPDKSLLRQRTFLNEAESAEEADERMAEWKRVSRDVLPLMNTAVKEVGYCTPQMLIAVTAGERGRPVQATDAFHKMLNHYFPASGPPLQGGGRSRSRSSSRSRASTSSDDDEDNSDDSDESTYSDDGGNEGEDAYPHIPHWIYETLQWQMGQEGDVFRAAVPWNTNIQLFATSRAWALLHHLARRRVIATARALGLRMGRGNSTATTATPAQLFDALGDWTATDVQRLYRHTRNYWALMEQALGAALGSLFSPVHLFDQQPKMRKLAGGAHVQRHATTFGVRTLFLGSDSAFAMSYLVQWAHECATTMEREAARFETDTTRSIFVFNFVPNYNEAWNAPPRYPVQVSMRHEANVRRRQGEMNTAVLEVTKEAAALRRSRGIAIGVMGPRDDPSQPIPFSAVVAHLTKPHASVAVRDITRWRDMAMRLVGNAQARALRSAAFWRKRGLDAAATAAATAAFKNNRVSDVELRLRSLLTRAFAHSTNATDRMRQAELRKFKALHAEDGDEEAAEATTTIRTIPRRTTHGNGSSGSNSDSDSGDETKTSEELEARRRALAKRRGGRTVLEVLDGLARLDLTVTSLEDDEEVARLATQARVQPSELWHPSGMKLGAAVAAAARVVADGIHGTHSVRRQDAPVVAWMEATTPAEDREAALLATAERLVERAEAERDFVQDRVEAFHLHPTQMPWSQYLAVRSAMQRATQATSAAVPFVDVVRRKHHGDRDRAHAEDDERAWRAADGDELLKTWYPARAFRSTRHRWAALEQDVEAVEEYLRYASTPKLILAQLEDEDKARVRRGLMPFMHPSGVSMEMFVRVYHDIDAHVVPEEVRARVVEWRDHPARHDELARRAVRRVKSAARRAFARSYRMDRQQRKDAAGRRRAEARAARARQYTHTWHPRVEEAMDAQESSVQEAKDAWRAARDHAYHVVTQGQTDLNVHGQALNRVARQLRAQNGSTTLVERGEEQLATMAAQLSSVSTVLHKAVDVEAWAAARRVMASLAPTSKAYRRMADKFLDLQETTQTRLAHLQSSQRRYVNTFKRAVARHEKARAAARWDTHATTLNDALETVRAAAEAFASSTAALEDVAHTIGEDVQRFAAVVAQHTAWRTSDASAARRVWKAIKAKRASNAMVAWEEARGRYKKVFAAWEKLVHQFDVGRMVVAVASTHGVSTSKHEDGTVEVPSYRLDEDAAHRRLYGEDGMRLGGLVLARGTLAQWYQVMKVRSAHEVAHTSTPQKAYMDSVRTLDATAVDTAAAFVARWGL